MTPKEQVFADLVSELRTTGNVTVRGFGTFKVKAMAARVGRNPATGAAVNIPAKNKIVFTPAKTLKETF